MIADDPASAYDAWYESELGAAAHAIELALVAELAEPRALALAVTPFSFLDPGQRTRATAELVRVVRPRGRIVIGDLARFGLWAMQRRLRGWRGSATWREARFFTAGDLRELLQRAGAGRVTTRYAL
jgi:hypothetical protein